MIALAFVVLGLIGQSEPDAIADGVSNNEDGPSLKDRRKAMIEQTHFFKLTHTQKTRLQAAKSSTLRRLYYSTF